jgi:DNA primase
MSFEGVVDEVRARADIVEIVGEHVTLKRRGSDFWAPCPFHKEKSPSFHVVPARGFFKCFGCGESGDVFSFLMKHLGLSFPEALRMVAARVGVEIPERTQGREQDEPHRLLYEAVAFAVDYYRRQLQDPTVGERARNYLASRGIGKEAIERFQLGYAPDDWQGVRAAARRHGIADEVLLEAGLVKTGDRTDEPYDRQRDRVIFPIADANGRVIAFGGRLLGAERKGAPKYLNSPETPIYHKGLHLYGLAWAKGAVRREGAALVVEGYMDYVSLASRGVENVVAGLGTAMTTEQGALLARYTRQALLLYDSDAAGLRATFRTADALLSAGVHPLVVTLPRGEDPDSLVRKGGAGALKPHLDAALDVLDLKLRMLEERGYFTSAEGTRKALDGLLPTLRAVTDPVLRDIYLSRAAERTGVRRETLEAELEAAPPPAPPTARRPEGAPAWEEARRGVERRGVDRRNADRGGVEHEPPRRAERVRARAEEGKFLLLLLRDEDRIAQAAGALSAEEFSDPLYREIFVELVRTGGLQGRGPLALKLSDPARARLEALLGDPVELVDGNRIFGEVVGDIRARRLFERIEALKARFSTASGEEELALFRERAELQRALQQIGSELKGLGFKLSNRYRNNLRAER